MRRALPAIAVSAAGVTWLLHAQGVIDAAGAPTTSTATAAGATPPVRTGATTSTTPARGAPSTSTPTTRPGRGTPSTTTPPTTAPTASGGGSGSTVTGPSVSTRFGPVQVAVIVSDGKVTDIKTLQSPDSARRSQQINSRALPILRQEAVAAQSSNIDAVSGATITSDAYATSLQAALDQAGLR